MDFLLMGDTSIEQAKGEGGNENYRWENDS